jgi:hypothetical protein
VLLSTIAACGSARVLTATSSTHTDAPAATTTSASPSESAVVSDPVPHLWMNTRVIPPAGGPVAFAVVVPPGSGPATTSGGVDGELERLEGSAWTSVGQFGASLDFWGGFGSVVGPGEELAIPAIGLTVPERGVGALEFLMIPKLEPGRYRLRSGSVTGEFDVRIDAPPPPRLASQERGGLGLLTVSPALVSTQGGPIILTADVGSSIDELTTFTAELGPDADVDQWTGGAWQPRGTFRVTPAPVSNLAAVAITLPRLPEGMYRVVRHHPRGDLTREFWTTSDLGPSANEPPFTIAGWTLVSTGNGADFSRADAATLSLTISDLATADPGWQPGASMQVDARSTVRGWPAALVSLRDGGPDASRLIVVADHARRLVLRGSATVTDADLVAALEALEPFPLTGAPAVPDVPGRLTGSVAGLMGQEGAATVTGWLVVTPEGKYRLCDSVERAPTLRCTGPTFEVDASFIHWDPPPTTAVGTGRISIDRSAFSGSLKGDILFLGVL